MQDLLDLVQAITPEDKISLRTPEGISITTLDKVSFVQKERDAIKVHLTDGSEAEVVSTPQDIFKQLNSDQQWFKTHRDILINLRNLIEINPGKPPEQQIEDEEDRLAGSYYHVTLKGGSVATVTPHYAPKLAEHFNLQNLEHITPFNRVAYWLMKENLHDYDKPITKMSVKELTEHFSEDSSDRIIVSNLIANFLWQFVSYIRKGEAEPLEGGNVRSLWYLIKPTLSRIGALSGMDHYKTLSEKMAHFSAHHIMKYKEFGLIEEGNWSIGTTRPDVILVAEKRAHFYFLKKMQKEFGVSIIALGGKPKTITSEYFTDAFKEQIPDYHNLENIKLIGLIDYDPSGQIIEETFQDDLRIFDLKKTTYQGLVIPENFTQEELEVYKYNLLETYDAVGQPQSKWPKELKDWLRDTNGINGEPFGLETDALMLDQGIIIKMIQEIIN
jgi:hypothetical protein